MNSTSSNHPLSFVEHALAMVDLIVGIVLMVLAVLGIISTLLPVRSGSDNTILGLIAGIAILPFGLAALAAWDAVRNRSTGRWALQVLTAVPIAVLVYLVAKN
jgi:hypothetical protein